MTLYAVLFDDVDAPPSSLTEITLSTAVTVSASESDTYMPAESVTIAELIVDAGSASETRTIVDPTYPGADGDVTWVATDPLTGTDPGGKARYWARYPDGSGGFWRRDDWNALTVAEGSANAISLDWAVLDDDEDASAVLQELLDQYIDGSEGNVLSMKGPEDITSLVFGGLAITGDGSASAWYWYRPETVKCIHSTKPWSIGTEDLIAKTWSDLGSNRWSTTVTEDVNFLRACDPSFKSASNTNTSKGPWLGGLDLQTSAVSVNSAREWFYDSGTNTLTVYATSDPSTYFTPGTSSTADGMQYITDMTDLDHVGQFTDIHTVYIEGGGSFFHSDNGLESRGRAGPEPWGGGAGSQLVSTTGWVFEYTNANFTKAGSSLTFLPGLSQFVFDGITLTTTPANFQILEKFTIGGVHSTQILPTTDTTAVPDWWHGHKGDSAGEAFRNLRLWGETSNGWDGAISPTGADTTGTDNTSTGKPWPFARIRRMNSFEKVTGQLEGYGSLPFTGRKGSVQIGESLDDPLKVIHWGGTFGIAGDYATYSPNGRPVFFDDNESVSIHFDKTDAFNTHRGGTNFLWIENTGVTDPFTGAAINVDIRANGTNVLNVEADPAALDLGRRAPTTSFEVTIPEAGGGGFAGTDLKLSGPGQGIYLFSEIDFRFPYNWSGYWTIHGINDDCHMFLEGVQENTTISGFTFVDMYSSAIHQPEVAVQVLTETYFSTPDNITIRDCGFEGNRIVKIGNGLNRAPYRIFLKDLTVTGDNGKTFVDIDPFTAGNFNEGSPIVLEANNTDGWDADIVVDIPDAEHGDDVYFSDNGGATWYEIPFTVGGSNTTKDFPPDLATLNTAWRTFNGTGRDIYMPQFFHNGNHCTVVLWFDGDPGTFTETSGFTAISGISANLSDGSLYVRGFERDYEIGTDCWDESLTTNSNSDSIRKTFTWTNSVMGWGASVENTGQADTSPIGNASSTAHNTASTSHTAPTVSASKNSKMMSFIGMPGNAQVSNFAGTVSPWVAHVTKELGSSLWGRTGTDGFTNEPGSSGGTPTDIAVSFAMASIYTGAAGSKAGCAYTIDSSLKAITTSIEIKTGPKLIHFNTQTTGVAEESDQLNP